MIEESLLTKIIKEGDLRTPINLKITEDFFYAPLNRSLYAFLLRYFNDPATRGNVPTIELVTSRFKEFNFRDAHQSIEALSEELRERKIETDVSRICDETLTEVRSDPTKALYGLRDKLTNLQASSTKSRDLNFASSVEAIKERYLFMENLKGITGIPYPWPSLTDESLGAQKGEFVIFYGRPKSMKTWLLLQIACNAYLKHHYRVALFTWEMTPEQLMQRMASLLTKVDYNLWRKGRLSEEDKIKAFACMDAIASWEHSKSGRQDRPYLTITTDIGDPRGGGVSTVRQKIEELDPDIVLVDGFYQMRDDRNNKRTVKWVNQTAIIQDLKSLSIDLNVPIISSTQANRAGQSTDDDLGTTDIAFADAAGMYADYAIKVIKIPKKDEEDKENVNSVRDEMLMEYQGRHGATLICQITAAREFQLDGFQLYANPGSGITEDRPLTEGMLRKILSRAKPKKKALKEKSAKEILEAADKAEAERKAKEQEEQEAKDKAQQQLDEDTKKRLKKEKWPDKK
jgi:replicative DNA helicase